MKRKPLTPEEHDFMRQLQRIRASKGEPPKTIARKLADLEKRRNLLTFLGRDAYRELLTTEED